MEMFRALPPYVQPWQRLLVQEISSGLQRLSRSVTLELFYGERCFEFLFGVRFIWFYGVVFVAMVLLGGFIELDMVWIIADIVNALMALPNLIALLALSPVVIAETKKYFGK